MKHFQIFKELPKSRTLPLLKMEWKAQETFGSQKTSSSNPKGSSEESPKILDDSDEGRPVHAKRRCVTSSITSRKTTTSKAPPWLFYTDSDDKSQPKATSLAEGTLMYYQILVKN